jgi:hypothetical protein
MDQASLHRHCYNFPVVNARATVVRSRAQAVVVLAVWVAGLMVPNPIAAADRSIFRLNDRPGYHKSVCALSIICHMAIYILLDITDI